MPTPEPSASIIIREHRGQPFYEAKFRHGGRQVKRRIGPAWLERDPETGGWRKHRGRVAEDAYDERAAHVAAAKLVSEYVEQATHIERIERERRSQGATFREVAHAYLCWLEDVRGAKPSTLAGHRARRSPSRAPRTSAAAGSRSGMSWLRSAIDRPRGSPRARSRTCWRRSARRVSRRGP